MNLSHPPDEFEPTGDSRAKERETHTRSDAPREAPVTYRGATSDPSFGYLIAIALALGLIALPEGFADLRYTLSWSVLAGVGVLAWLLGNCERIGQEEPENLAWGIAFGLIIGAPLLAFGGDILGNLAKLIFPGMTAGALLAYLIFVMPLGETLFFRNVLQQNRPWWIVGLLSSLWSVVLFFPTMWGDILASPAVGVIIAVMLIIINIIYSYVRHRNGLAAAWVCQIAINLIVVFLPSL
jgi:hypothetical protein